MGQIFSGSPFAKTTSGDSSKISKSNPSLVPPPPKQEVNYAIRTMASDLGQMTVVTDDKPKTPYEALTGSRVVSADTVALPEPQVVVGTSSRINYALITGGIILVVVALVLGGYFIWPKFFNEAKPTPNNNASSTGSGLGGNNPTQGERVHTSFFVKPTDKKMRFSVREDLLETGNIRVGLSSFVLDQASGTRPMFIEVDLYNNKEVPLSWSEMLGLLGASRDMTDWSERFEDDFTFFVYRDRDGFWPGYVSQVKPGQNSLAVQSAVYRIEKEPSLIRQFYFEDPGEMQGEFVDVSVFSDRARHVQFSKPGADFIYSLVFENRYLIISTSIEGIRQAASRL